MPPPPCPPQIWTQGGLDWKNLRDIRQTIRAVGTLADLKPPREYYTLFKKLNMPKAFKKYAACRPLLCNAGARALPRPRPSPDTWSWSCAPGEGYVCAPCASTMRATVRSVAVCRCLLPLRYPTTPSVQAHTTVRNGCVKQIGANGRNRAAITCNRAPCSM